jgi:hypothetical protein
VSAPKRPPDGPWPRRPDEVVREVALPGGGVVRERSDLLGKLTLQEWPDGSWLRFGYDGDGTLRRLEHSSGERIDYQFDAGERTW